MGRAISVRLDEEALRALRWLEASGLTRSEAIRVAIVESATRRRSKRALRAEVRRLEDDAADQEEMARVAEMMEHLRAPR